MESAKRKEDLMGTLRLIGFCRVDGGAALDRVDRVDEARVS